MPTNIQRPYRSHQKCFSVDASFSFTHMNPASAMRSKRKTAHTPLPCAVQHQKVTRKQQSFTQLTKNASYWQGSHLRLAFFLTCASLSLVPRMSHLRPGFALTCASLIGVGSKPNVTRVNRVQSATEWTASACSYFTHVQT